MMARNIVLIIFTLVISLVLVGVVTYGFSKLSSQPVNSATVLGSSERVFGKSDAKVTIVEFSDFQCPACRAVQPLLKQILGKYPNDVRLIYRNFPLVSIHKNAQLAAIASELVANYGKFNAYHDLLFEKQADWAQLDDPTNQFGEYAQQLGIEKTVFMQEFKAKEGELRARVSKDIQDGVQLGINATPTFFVNNVKTPVQSLLQTVESSLQK